MRNRQMKTLCHLVLTFIECDVEGCVLAAGVWGRSSLPGGCAHLPAIRGSQLHPVLDPLGWRTPLPPPPGVLGGSAHSPPLYTQTGRGQPAASDQLSELWVLRSSAPQPQSGRCHKVQSSPWDGLEAGLRPNPQVISPCSPCSASPLPPPPPRRVLPQQSTGVTSSVPGSASKEARFPQSAPATEGSRCSSPHPGACLGEGHRRINRCVQRRAKATASENTRSSGNGSGG